ncbi:MAG: hypothetical protein GY851_12550 [bacterium]|nr:hypothetical protein [bacterium]
MAATCKLTVQAGEHDRNCCPVRVELPWNAKEVKFVDLKDTKTKKLIACQVERSKGGIALTWLVNGLKAGQTQKLVAKPAKADTARPGVVLTDVVSESRVAVDILGKPFTSYHYGCEWVRPFMHPILGPNDAKVTRSYPITKDVKGEKQDHPHHKSVWVAYGECDRVDNWSEDKGHGWQRHRKFIKKASGPVFGQITALNDWCTNAERKQFEEVRDVKFYALPGGARLLDVAVTFKMTQKQVTFRDTKEGGLLSVRVASSMDVPVGGKIENGYGGINEAETWGKSAPWCDYSGTVDGTHVGVAILDHETNPRYPTGWHVRNYGLMTANCFASSYYRPEAKVRGDMVFKKGSKTTWRYRLYVHRGDARKGKVANRFHDFVAPPVIGVE